MLGRVVAAMTDPQRSPDVRSFANEVIRLWDKERP